MKRLIVLSIFAAALIIPNAAFADGIFSSFSVETSLSSVPETVATVQVPSPGIPSVLSSFYWTGKSVDLVQYSAMEGFSSAISLTPNEELSIVEEDVQRMCCTATSGPVSITVCKGWLLSNNVGSLSRACQAAGDALDDLLDEQ